MYRIFMMISLAAKVRLKFLKKRRPSVFGLLISRTCLILANSTNTGFSNCSSAFHSYTELLLRLKNEEVLARHARSVKRFGRNGRICATVRPKLLTSRFRMAAPPGPIGDCQGLSESGLRTKIGPAQPENQDDTLSDT